MKFQRLIFIPSVVGITSWFCSNKLGLLAKKPRPTWTAKACPVQFLSINLTYRKGRQVSVSYTLRTGLRKACVGAGFSPNTITIPYGVGLVLYLGRGVGKYLMPCNADIFVGITSLTYIILPYPAKIRRDGARKLISDISKTKTSSAGARH